MSGVESCHSSDRQTDVSHCYQHTKMTSNEPSELPELITLEQAAERLTVCRRTIEREIARGRFPKPVRIGRATRISVAALRAYVAGLHNPALNQPAP